MANPREGTRGSIESMFEGRHPGTLHLARYFAWSHLPPHLAEVSRPCCDVMTELVAVLPDGPELTAGLRKLLEAKDCFVRAALDREN